MAPPALWPSRPRPLPDETFASWFARLARANGLEPRELFRAAMPGGYLFSQDLDRCPQPQLIVTLAERAGMTPGRIVETTLAGWYGRLIEEDDGLNKLPWLPPPGNEASKRSYGQQICPACLAEDRPYLRRIWRLGFVTACPIHRRLLLDRCPQCSAPFSPTKGWDERARFRCWRCGQKLAGVASQPLAWPQDLEIQEALTLAAAEGWMVLGAYGPTHSLAAFRVLTQVYRLLATGRHALPLRAWTAEHSSLPASPPSAIPRVKEVELLNPRCRQELLRLAWFLFQDWPERFVAACSATGIGSRQLLHGRTTPFAYWHAVTSRLCSPQREIGADEIAAAKGYLHRRGRRADFDTLAALTGIKIQAHRTLADPVSDHIAYGRGRYWKLDGVSPETRAAVKRAARRDGENVAGWVEKALKEALRER